MRQRVTGGDELKAGSWSTLQSWSNSDEKASLQIGHCYRCRAVFPCSTCCYSGRDTDDHFWPTANVCVHFFRDHRHGGCVLHEITRQAPDSTEQNIRGGQSDTLSWP